MYVNITVDSIKKCNILRIHTWGEGDFLWSLLYFMVCIVSGETRLLGLNVAYPSWESWNNIRLWPPCIKSLSPVCSSRLFQSWESFSTVFQPGRPIPLSFQLYKTTIFTIVWLSMTMTRRVYLFSINFQCWNNFRNQVLGIHNSSLLENWFTLKYLFIIIKNQDSLKIK